MIRLASSCPSRRSSSGNDSSKKCEPSFGKETVEIQASPEARGIAHHIGRTRATDVRWKIRLLVAAEGVETRRRG